MMQPLKSKGRITIPMTRSWKSSKDETHDPSKTNEGQSSSDHHHRISNPLFLFAKMKHKLHHKPKKGEPELPYKPLPHPDSKLREIFARFDTNMDGQVESWDLGSLIRALGGNPTQAELDKITTQEKLYGPIDFDQFVCLVGKYFFDGMNHDKEVEQAFEVLDPDADGYVAVSDLKLLLTTSGEKLDSAEFDQWIQDVAIGPDGKVRYKDVAKTL